jgi:hypothetical protein
VGYGRPPKSTRWKKGQSGNPSGKAKKEASLRATLKKIAGQEIVVHENGAAVSMRRDEAMLQAIVVKAMKGDLAAVKFIAEMIGIEPESSAGPPEFETTDLDLTVLQRHADWVGLLENGRAEHASADQDDATNGGSADDEATEDF